MKMILGLLGGAVLGAGAALLFAPQSGRASRALLRDKATKCTHDVQDLVQSKGEHLRNKLQGFKHHAVELAEKAPDLQEMTDDLAQRGHEILDRGQEVLSHGMDALTKAKSALDTALDEEEAEPTLA